jgi:hypothetical protein
VQINEFNHVEYQTLHVQLIEAQSLSLSHHLIWNGLQPAQMSAESKFTSGSARVLLTGGIGLPAAHKG